MGRAAIKGTRLPRKQRGIAYMALVVVALIAVGLVIATRQLALLADEELDSQEQSERSLEMIRDALVSYVASHGYLPCPANPANDLGSAAPANASANCTVPAGTVPWRTLGIPLEMALDGWGTKVSYRVFAGAIGLTQTDGASMVNCDVSIPTGADPVLDAGNLCKASHMNLDTAFMAAKGAALTVNNQGSNQSGMGFVLISHGPTGYGGWSLGGTQKPLPSNVGELANANAGGTYHRLAASSTSVPASDPAHFDDLLLWMPVREIIETAGRGARDWPDPALPEFTIPTTTDMTQPSTDPSAPHFLTDAAAEGGFIATTSGGQTAVQAGAGAGIFSSCLWWPNRLLLAHALGRNKLTAFVEFAAADNPNDEFAGFTMGFLAGNGTAPTNDTCGTTFDVAVSATTSGAGDSDEIVVTNPTGIFVGQDVFGPSIPPNTQVDSISGSVIELTRDWFGPFSGTVFFGDATAIRRDMGWAGGTLGSVVDRFAVEFDAHDNGSANDPNRPHLAVDYTDVVHNGTAAASCGVPAWGNGCDRVNSSFADVTTSATGTAGSTLLNVPTPTGITHGMLVTGGGIAAGARVTARSGSGVTLSLANAGAVGGTLDFDSVSNDDFMQFGVDVFNGARVEVTPRECVGTTANGTIANFSIAVANAALIEPGMRVYGRGIAHGTTVLVVSGATVALSKALTASFVDQTAFGYAAPVQVTGSGTSGNPVITVSDSTNLFPGMSVAGSGVGTGAVVTSVTGPTVIVSVPNAANVSGTLAFGGASPVSISAVGTGSASTIDVASVSGVKPGMAVQGVGIAPGARVLSIAGNTVTLDAANTTDINGTVRFALPRTLVRSWTLSNSGCQDDPALCAQLQNTAVPFDADTSTMPQVLHAAACVPLLSSVGAHDTLYFGLTSSNRATGTNDLPNLVFRGLDVSVVAQQ